MVPFRYPSKLRKRIRNTTVEEDHDGDTSHQLNPWSSDTPASPKPMQLWAASQMGNKGTSC